MEKQLISQDKNVKKYLFKFTSVEFDKAEKQILNEVNQHYSFEGFRKGKAPKSLVKTRFGEQFEQWIHGLLLEQVEKDLEKDTTLCLAPMLDSTSVDNGNVEFEVTAHEFPVVKNTSFENLVVEVPESAHIIENYIKRRLDSILDTNAILDPKEGPAEFEDYIRIKYSVFNKEGKEVRKETEDEYTLNKENGGSMAEVIVGKTAGESFTFERENDENYFKYEITLLDVYKRTIPELTDELVKSLNMEGVNTIDELKANLTEEGQKNYDVWKKDYIRSFIMNDCINHAEFDYSDETIVEYTNRAVENAKEDAAKFEQTLAQHDNDESKLFDAFKKEVEMMLKETSLITKIAMEHDIKVEQNDVDEIIHNIAMSYQLPVERAREAVKSNPNLFNQITNDAIKMKVADFISEKVQIKEVENKELEEEAEESVE